MAHLSERHGEATRRRGELLRERAQALALRTGYPEVFHRARSNHSASTSNTAAASDPNGQLTAASKSGVAHEDSSHPHHRRLSPEELAEFSRRCEQRVAITRGKELQTHRQALELEQKRLQRSQLAGEAAPAQATQRLRDRREQLRRTAEAELDALVAQQDSSLDAMNIARLLSPRFQEHVSFAPSVVQYSAEDERVKHLLTNDRVGSYYQ